MKKARKCKHVHIKRDSKYALYGKKPPKSCANCGKRGCVVSCKYLTSVNVKAFESITGLSLDPRECVKVKFDVEVCDGRG